MKRSLSNIMMLDHNRYQTIYNCDAGEVLVIQEKDDDSPSMRFKTYRFNPHMMIARNMRDHININMYHIMGDLYAYITLKMVRSYGV